MKTSNQIKYEILPERAVFIPEWPLDELKNRNCPLCGIKRETLFLRSDKLPVAYCDSCSLWFVNKIPEEAVIYKIYEQYYKIIRPVKFDNLLVGKIKKNGNRILKVPENDFRISKLISILGELKGKKILEIGCGSGEFLYYLSKLGADVIGCEFSSEACDFINNSLHLKAYCGVLEKYVDQIGKVDVVLLNDVLEHFIDPAKTLEQISLLLNKKGILLIWTPNGSDAGETLESAKEWIGFSMDLEHLQYFSHKTISRISDKFSLEITHLESLGQPCLEKLKDFKPAYFKQKISQIRFELSVFLSNFLIIRIIKDGIKKILGLKNNTVGNYVLFAILRKVD